LRDYKDIENPDIGEGGFTKQGGGSLYYMDRIKTQESISNMIEEVFGEKKRLTIADYLNIIENRSSEMFLSIMVLIQSCLPCSENFYRYKHNYEKIKQG